MKLIDFDIKPNIGWTSVLANCDLRSLGFKTDRLAKFDGAGSVQVTIGSTIQGQAFKLNSEIEGLIENVFPTTKLTYTASTHGNVVKPKYPTFQVNGNCDKLNEFFNQLELLIVQRS